MKNFLIKTSLILLLLASTTNCSDEQSTTAQDTVNTSAKFSTARMNAKLTLNDLVEQPEMIGEIHNQSLDYTLNELEKLSEEEVQNLNIQEFVNLQTSNYMNSKFELDSLNVSDFIIYDDFDVTTKTNLILFYEDLINNIDTATSVASFVTDTESIYLNYLSLSADDNYILQIKSTYSVAIKSFEYWHNTANIAKWAKGKPSTGTVNIIKADVKGAVKGVIWSNKNLSPANPASTQLSLIAGSSSAMAGSAWKAISDFWK